MTTSASAGEPPCGVYAVPWKVDRADPRHPVMTNVSTEVLDTVRCFVGDRHGRARTDRFGSLRSGDAVQLCLCRADLPSTIVTLAWYRPGTDEEFLWRFVL
ncbi:hypothetical protein [Microbacterium halotolerans]|uniref:hypothetical protein n=1 Tax=Microbacterium halotolerans TaxID=246613 RepID=UPI000E6ABCEC|nr:hypothetical protein [Microbacterium halotolerans]